MFYKPIQFSGGVPHYQHVVNSLKARDRPSRPKIPVLAHIVWEVDGEQWCHGEAVRLDPGMAIFVELSDPRCRFTGVWLSPGEVIWPGKQ